jgi:integrase
MKATKKPEKSVSGIETDKIIASMPKYFSQDEIQAILSVLHDGENRLLFQLGLELGARVSEIESLKWSNVNFKDKYIVIWDEKKDCFRTCTVPDYIWELLKEFKKGIDTRKEGRVFPYSYKTLNRRIKEWTIKASLERLFYSKGSTPDLKQSKARWHFLRHTYVVQSRRAGRDWDVISQQTGDRVSTLIQEYSKLSLEDRIRISTEKPIVQRGADQDG